MSGSGGGIEFEIGVQEQFTSLGWDVRRTAVTGDFGADLVAQANGEILVVQCKDYGAPAGIKSVQEVHLARAHYGASAAAVVARSGFTRAATQVAATAGVYLFRPSDIIPGSCFDRTLYRQEMERRERARIQARENERASIAWAQYDMALIRHKKFMKIKAILFKVLFCSELLAVFFIAGGHLGDSAFALFLAAITQGYFLILLRLSLLGPQQPTHERKGAIVACRSCGQKLRIDHGRAGNVRCPKCGGLTAVSIPESHFNPRPPRPTAGDESFVE